MYSILIDNSVSFSTVAAKANGCIWNLTFSDGTSSQIKVPSDYSGTLQCDFASANFDENDSINLGAYQLLAALIWTMTAR